MFVCVYLWVLRRPDEGIAARVTGICELPEVSVGNQISESRRTTNSLSNSLAPKGRLLIFFFLFKERKVAKEMAQE